MCIARQKKAIRISGSTERDAGHDETCNRLQNVLHPSRQSTLLVFHQCDRTSYLAAPTSRADVATHLSPFLPGVAVQEEAKISAGFCRVSLFLIAKTTDAQWAAFWLKFSTAIVVH